MFNRGGGFRWRLGAAVISGARGWSGLDPTCVICQPSLHLSAVVCRCRPSSYSYLEVKGGYSFYESAITSRSDDSNGETTRVQLQKFHQITGGNHNLCIRPLMVFLKPTDLRVQLAKGMPLERLQIGRYYV